MMDSLLSYWEIPLFRYALFGGVLVALCAALLGTTLVLRRFSMIGDGLSHIGFGALAAASVANVLPMAVAIPVMIAAAFLLLRGSAQGKLRGDAAVALMSTTCLAAGMILTYLGGGTNVDLMNYLFGSIFSLSQKDLWLAIALASLVLPCYGLLYHRIFAVTFDEPFARATGVQAGAFQFATAVFTALTIVLGMRLTGTLLISCLLVFPTLSAMRINGSFFGVTLISAAIGVGCFLLGFVLACLYPGGLPAGASIVAVNAAAFSICAGAGEIVRRRRAHH
ncbi:MAG: metal ABC transporter permease [Oscillospiraceae bacterium]|jgi:zinc transport system permease protein|nr:metal ABC transporter permease [Oscillospiraceae bacterium]